MRRLLTLLTTLMLTMAALSGVVPPASAAISTSNTVTTATMYVSGFDPDVAQAHGYSRVKPFNVVGGNCGSSYLFLTGRPRGLLIQTGFSVIHGVISYAWAVDVYGPSGFRKTWGGTDGFDSTWDGSATQGNLKPGTYNGLVTSPAWALMDNGVICTSNHPSDTQPVF